MNSRYFPQLPISILTVIKKVDSSNAIAINTNDY